MSRAADLRRRLADPPILVVPGAFDALSARVIEESGFGAVYVTGAGFANAAFGVPDLGLVSATEVVTHVERIADAVDIPVIADADTGYGAPLVVYRTFRALERAGAAAIQLEDQVLAKRCGHFDRHTVVPIQEMLARLAAAFDARCDDATVVIARTDARSAEGFDAAIERANAYAAAGADLVFLEALRDRDELAAAARSVSAPLLANIVEGGKTPPLSAAELDRLGYRIALFANTALRVATRAVQLAMAQLSDTGTTDGLRAEMLTWNERKRLTGLSEAEQRETRYVAAGRGPRANPGDFDPAEETAAR